MLEYKGLCRVENLIKRKCGERYFEILLFNNKFSNYFLLVLELISPKWKNVFIFLVQHCANNFLYCTHKIELEVLI